MKHGNKDALLLLLRFPSPLPLLRVTCRASRRRWHGALIALGYSLGVRPSHLLPVYVIFASCLLDDSPVIMSDTAAGVPDLPNSKQNLKFCQVLRQLMDWGWLQWRQTFMANITLIFSPIRQRRAFYIQICMTINLSCSKKSTFTKSVTDRLAEFARH